MRGVMTVPSRAWTRANQPITSAGCSTSWNLTTAMLAGDDDARIGPQIGNDESEAGHDADDQRQIDADDGQAEAVQQGEHQADGKLAADKSSQDPVDLPAQGQNVFPEAGRDENDGRLLHPVEIPQQIEEVDGDDEIPENRQQQTEGGRKGAGEKDDDLVNDVERKVFHPGQQPAQQPLEVLPSGDSKSLEKRLGDKPVQAFGIAGKRALNQQKFFFKNRNDKRQKSAGNQDENGEYQHDGGGAGDAAALQKIDGRVEKVRENQRQKKGDGHRADHIQAKDRQDEYQDTEAVITKTARHAGQSFRKTYVRPTRREEERPSLQIAREKGGDIFRVGTAPRNRPLGCSDERADGVKSGHSGIASDNHCGGRPREHRVPGRLIPVPGKRQKSPLRAVAAFIQGPAVPNPERSLAGAGSVLSPMQPEGTVRGSDRGDGVFVEQNIAAALDEQAKTVEGLDIALQLFAGHHRNRHADPLFTGLIEVLILNVEWGLSHVRSLLMHKNLQSTPEF